MSDKVNNRATDLAEFDQGWFATMEQTPFVKAIIALSGLTRLGDHPPRLVHIGDRTLGMGSGCGPDVFTFAAVLDVPFTVEETCPTTGTPIRVDFVPGGYERVDPPEAVTVLLRPDEFRDSVGGHFDEINANVYS